MKQLESRAATVGDRTFYIRPFAAFKAANISGKLAALITPILSGLLPLADTEDGAKGIFDVPMEKVAPAVTGAFSSLSGDQLEEILRELLTKNKNVSTDDPDTGKAVLLTDDLANEMFCEELQDMYMLAFEVIKVNYGNFFKKLGAQFGTAIESMKAKAPSTASMAG